MSIENMEALAFYIEVCEGEISKFKNQLDATTDEVDKHIIECRIANRQEELSELKSKQVEMNGGNNVENQFINQIEAAKQHIALSKQRITEYKQGGEMAKPFLLKEEGYLKGLEQKLNALETLFFQYSQEAMQAWIDDTQDYLNGLHERELV